MYTVKPAATNKKSQKYSKIIINEIKMPQCNMLT